MKILSLLLASLLLQSCQARPLNLRARQLTYYTSIDGNNIIAILDNKLYLGPKLRGLSIKSLVETRGMALSDEHGTTQCKATQSLVFAKEIKQSVELCGGVEFKKSRAVGGHVDAACWSFFDGKCHVRPRYTKPVLVYAYEVTDGRINNIRLGEGRDAIFKLVEGSGI